MVKYSLIFVIKYGLDADTIKKPGQTMPLLSSFILVAFEACKKCNKTMACNVTDGVFNGKQRTQVAARASFRPGVCLSVLIYTGGGMNN